MRLFDFNLFSILFSTLLLIVYAPGVRSAPTSQPTDLQIAAAKAAAISPNSAIEARASLEKRDSWDCKGSASCGNVDQDSCLRAISNYSPYITYVWEARYIGRNANNDGYCLAMWTCGNQADYDSAAAWGISNGQKLRDKYVTSFT
ncbi:hypothetical protein TWF281_011016 [Arthrobotrys megalospora]